MRCDPGEDPVEMPVVDDDARHELRLIPGMQPIREHPPVAADRDRAVGGLADEGQRSAATAACFRIGSIPVIRPSSCPVVVEHKRLDGVFAWIAAQRRERNAARLTNPKLSLRAKKGIRTASPPS